MVDLMPIGFTPVPDWFSFDNQGAAVASADVSGNGRPDLVVLMIDNAPDQNSGLYRVGADVDATGAVTGGWGPWQPVPDWFSFENQGADVTGNGRLDVVVLLVDNPPVQNGNPSALVLPGEPVRDRLPRPPPAGHGTGGVEVAADAVEALVRTDRIVDEEHDDVGLAVASDVGDGDAGALVFPGEPVGHRLPGSPATGDGAGGVEVGADPVERLVLHRGVVDEEHDDVELAVAGDVGDGDAGALVLKGEPVGHRLPGSPAAGDGARGVDVGPNPVEPGVLVGCVVDHQDDQVRSAVAAHIGAGDGGALVVEREPVRNGRESYGHENDHPSSVVGRVRRSGAGQAQVCLLYTSPS